MRTGEQVVWKVGMDKTGLVNAGLTRALEPAKKPIAGKQKTATESSVTLARSHRAQRWKEPGLIIKTTRKNELQDTLKAGTMNLPLPGRWECSGT